MSYDTQSNTLQQFTAFAFPEQPSPSHTRFARAAHILRDAVRGPGRWLVLSYPSTTRRTLQGQPRLDSAWYDLATTSLSLLAQDAAQIAAQRTLYHGVALVHPGCTPQRGTRGRTATAYAIPGLWFDLDLAYGHHAASALPATDAQALAFLHSLPTEPSLIIHSGGGLYAWWLFREPRRITSHEDRTEIANLARQFAATLLEAGKQHGWTLDALGDLPRVLRPPGSINYKYDRPVTIVHESSTRYNPSDFTEWLLPLQHAPCSAHPRIPLAGQPAILAVADAYGVSLAKKSATELCGAHPVHGSSTGTKGLSRNKVIDCLFVWSVGG